MPHPHPLPPGGGRFGLHLDAQGNVVKRGDPAALAREAAALAVVGVPEVVSHRPGVLVTRRLPGAPRRPSTFTPDDLRELGRMLGRVHARTAPHADPAAYVAARLAAVRDAAAAAGLRIHLPTPPRPPRLAMIHGDLVAANIVWTPRPVPVDWEFWRDGDPAEDLAYLAALNGLDETAMALVARGHRDAAAVARAPGWRPLLVAEAAAWYLAHGQDAAAGELLRREGVSPPSPPN